MEDITLDEMHARPRSTHRNVLASLVGSSSFDEDLRNDVEWHAPQQMEYGRPSKALSTKDELHRRYDRTSLLKSNDSLQLQADELETRILKHQEEKLDHQIRIFEKSQRHKKIKEKLTHQESELKKTQNNFISKELKRLETLMTEADFRAFGNNTPDWEATLQLFSEAVSCADRTLRKVKSATNDDSG